MITASYKLTWCNSNPAFMHKGGHHLWKSDSVAFQIMCFTSLEMTTFYNWMTIFYQIDFEIHKNCFFQGKSLFQAIKGTWFKNQPRQIFTNGTLEAWRSNPTLREPQELFAMSRKTRFWLSREPCRFKVVTICFGFLSWKKAENGLIITNKKMWQTFFFSGSIWRLFEVVIN